MNKLNIFTLTHQEFAEHIRTVLGKGHVHAVLAYEELFRQGQISGRNPAFNNAQTLLKEILDYSDFTLPTLMGEKNDGSTGKFLLKTEDNLEIESVLIPMQSGGTLCVSSQVGCRMGCSFCETGRMGLLRNLRADEIIAQVFVARHVLGFNFRNVVFMGMGEPFDNYDAVMQAVKVLNDSKGLAFGRRQLTISTSGCIEGIEKLISEGAHAPNLAVSVNAPDDAIRNRLMPVNRKHNMEQLHAAMQKYCLETGRQILVAYVLLKGQNDSLEHAGQLAVYLKGLNVKINLIPYNAQSCDRYEAPELTVLEAFAQELRLQGYYTLLRLTKGKDIMAACGQLGNVKLRQQRRALQSL
jgi:23S rRNA (adenine2503-C2)-methyltransferase